MKRTEQISSIIFLIFAAITIVLSARIPMGNVSKPGPGFLPFWLGIILAFISIFLWVQSARHIIPGRRPQASSFNSQRVKDVVLTAASLTAFSLLIEYLGFLICSVILLFLLFRVIGKQKWLPSIVWTILATSASHLLFKVALKVQFPKGIFKI